MGEEAPQHRTLPRKPDPSRHARACKICKHPDRPEIEADFLRWRSPDDIGSEFHLTPRSLYRHAHATGLFRHRKRKLCRTLETFLERAAHVRVTAGDIIRAAKAYAHIDGDGEWVEPRSSHTTVVKRTKAQEKPEPSSSVAQELGSTGPQKSAPGDTRAPVSAFIATGERDASAFLPDRQSQSEIRPTP